MRRTHTQNVLLLANERMEVTYGISNCSHINSHNQVRGHRTGSRHSGAEEYPIYNSFMYEEHTQNILLLYNSRTPLPRLIWGERRAEEMLLHRRISCIIYFQDTQQIDQNKPPSRQVRASGYAATTILQIAVHLSAVVVAGKPHRKENINIHVPTYLSPLVGSEHH